MMRATPTACLILIGNEILSGRVRDTNLAWLSAALNEAGVKMAHARVIADDADIIAATVSELRRRYDYVFTTGGIGPTHDDITTASVARAFGVSVIRHPEAERRLRAHYEGSASVLNEARLKMADVPEGAELIDNPVSAAPGFRLENVFVLAGVPKIMQAMFDHLKQMLAGGRPTRARTLEVNRPEGDIAAALTRLQEEYAASVEIGVYPLIKNGVLGATLVLRSENAPTLDAATEAAQRRVTELGGNWTEI
jgi:molybdenum cofactor synthesis domain-containing protein